MLAILHALGMFVADFFKSRCRLEAENLFLRHQLSIALMRALENDVVASNSVGENPVSSPISILSHPRQTRQGFSVYTHVTLLLSPGRCPHPTLYDRGFSLLARLAPSYSSNSIAVDTVIAVNGFFD
jgi:hypothetical protein